MPRFPNSLYGLVCWIILGTGWTAAPCAASGIPQIVHLERPQFVDLAFPQKTPQRAMLRLTHDTLEQLQHILGHEYRGRRIRYWRTAETTAWIFDEIGKELPITIGIAVHKGEIALVRILVYREERGGEVHQGFFTSQFHQARLSADGDLTKPIDGITGATLSVQAVTRIARLALFLDKLVAQP